MTLLLTGFNKSSVNTQIMVSQAFWHSISNDISRVRKIEASQRFCENKKIWMILESQKVFGVNEEWIIFRIKSVIKT